MTFAMFSSTLGSTRVLRKEVMDLPQRGSRRNRQHPAAERESEALPSKTGARTAFKV
jgi:hypothetical protein